MNKQTILDLGGNEYTKNGHDRVYMSCEILNKLLPEGQSVNYGERNNKIFYETKSNQIMRSYKGKKPTIEYKF